MYYTDEGSVFGYSWTTRQILYIDGLRPFYVDETPRSASNETVNIGADDDVLPVLISRSRRNLQQPHRLGYD